MFIYEVSIQLPVEILPEFKGWLHPHVEEMTQLPYFTSATVFESKNLENGSIELKVHYMLKSASSLELYLQEAAPRMRGQLPSHLAEKVRYARNLLTSF
ncbi:DUF4286 family protein [bacterium]|nr:DUF4286 family protein [bacterium]